MGNISLDIPDKMEESMLRSILLFNASKVENSRNDMMQKTVLSVIIYGEGKYTIAKITALLKDRFGINLNEQEVNGHIEKLKKMKLVSLDGEKVNSFQSSRNKTSVIDQLDNETEQLISNVIDRIRHNSRITISTDDERVCRINIRKALTIYYKMYGYAFFNLRENAKKEDIGDAVCSARNGLHENVGKALIGALADLLNEPTEQERRTLQTWARAFVAMEIMNLDPSLRDFKATKIKGKAFVLDTDVLLNAITTNARYSKAYQKMIVTLRQIGCSFIVPNVVINEVENHIQAAIKRYLPDGQQWVDLTDEILENSIANVFIEDYAKTIRADENKRDMPFQSYIRNYYEPTDSTLLMNRVKGLLVQMKTLDLEHLSTSVQRRLKEKILERTQRSIKGTRRSEEENVEIAENDTALYLTLLKLNENEGVREVALSQKVYLLTRSHKTEISAKEVGVYEKNIICDPFALITILQEIGIITNNQFDFVNLFENPFLAFVADNIWSDVEPLLKAGAPLKYADIHRLRMDVDAEIDRILTCQTIDEKITEAKRLEKREYLFAKDLLALEEQRKQATDEVMLKNREIDEKNREIARLKEELEIQKRQTAIKQYKKRLKKKASYK